jgi:hypothetical protein
MNNDYFTMLLQELLTQYKEKFPIFLEVDIGFDGATASQRVEVSTQTVDYDVVIIGAHVNFSNSNVRIRVTDTSLGYVFNNQFMPITAIAGVTTQVMPVLQLPAPWLLQRQSKLQMEFINSAASLTDANGRIVWTGIRVR